MIKNRYLTFLMTIFLLVPVAASAVTHEVSVANNFFSPNDLTISVGDTVHWTSSGGMMHDVTADDGSWGSPTSSNIDYSRKFNSVAEVFYHCSVHSGPGGNISRQMNGRINVIQATPNQAPTANFDFNCTGFACTFMDQSADSDGTISGWSWDFGDGNAASAQSPVHTYAVSGSYMVSLTVTDDFGEDDTLSRNVIVSEPQQGLVKINRGMTDAWWNPATDGQGMLIVVWENIQFVFMAWFTFDTERPPEDVMAILGEPGHRWLTASGPFEGDTATLDVYLTTGGVFDAAQPPANTGPEPIGTAVIEWTGCNSGILTYTVPSLDLMGDIPIERIVLENVPICEAGQ